MFDHNPNLDSSDEKDIIDLTFPSENNGDKKVKKFMLRKKHQQLDLSKEGTILKQSKITPQLLKELTMKEKLKLLKAQLK